MDDSNILLSLSHKFDSFMCEQIWRCVPDSDRRDIYEDCIFTIAKREKEEAKALKKRNMKMLAQVSDIFNAN